MRPSRIAPRGRRLLRLAEFSPLMVGAYLALLLVIVPWQLMAFVITLQIRPGIGLTERMAAMDSLRGMVFNGPLRAAEAERHPLTRFEKASNESYPASLEDQIRLYDKNGKPVPYALGEKPFGALQDFEREYDARVYVYLFPSPPVPPQIAQAGDGKLLENAISSAPGTKHPSPFVALWMMSAPESKLPPAYQPGLSLGGNGGFGSDDSLTTVAEFAADEQVYRMYIVTRQGPDFAFDHSGDVQLAVSGSRPGTPQFQRILEEQARKYSAAIVVGGPLEVAPVPLRDPADGPSAERMAGAIWPELFESYSYGGLREADAEVRAPLGAKWYGISMRSGRTDGAPMMDNSQNLLYLVTWDGVPPLSGIPAEGSLDWYWREVRVAVSTVAAPLLAVGLFALIASLVASPLAFIRERKLDADERLTDEMRRVQRDAHDRVYNRLSALSRQVEGRAEGIRHDLHDGLGGIADDLQGTVDDLQRILRSPGDSSGAVPDDTAPPRTGSTYS